MKYWSEEIKNKAVVLRKRGLSYGEIGRELVVPKTTVYGWLREMGRSAVVDFKSRERWIRKIQPLGAEANRKKRERRLEELSERMKEEVSCLEIDREKARLVLAMLYWAEGSKGRDILSMANTDPRMLLLFVTLLRRVYDLDEEKFRLRLHLHHYHKEEELKEFWSDLLGIGLDKFHKSYWKPRNSNKRIRRNFGGICTLRYNNVHLKDELLFYARAVSDKVTGRNGVPVV